MRDRLYLVGFLAIAGSLLILGRDELPGSAIVTWALAFGSTTGVALLLLSLYRLQTELKQSRVELARREGELSFAREVQRALFPRELPRNCSLEMSAVCIPALGISGDYYDVLELTDGRVLFVIADVSGKGVSAAILMASIQALFRNLAEEGSGPLEVCQRLNTHLYRFTDPSKFATIFLGSWHPDSYSLTYVNAGHQIPVTGRVKPGGELKMGGPPVGLFGEAEYLSDTVVLEAGDLLVFYSDGVTEALSPDGREFGEHRLRQLVEASSDESLDELKFRILDTLQQWTNGEIGDDVTLFLFRVADRGKGIQTEGAENGVGNENL